VLPLLSSGGCAAQQIFEIKYWAIYFSGFGEILVFIKNAAFVRCKGIRLNVFNTLYFHDQFEFAGSARKIRLFSASLNATQANALQNKTLLRKLIAFQDAYRESPGQGLQRAASGAKPGEAAGAAIRRAARLFRTAARSPRRKRPGTSAFRKNHSMPVFRLPDAAAFA
jgi:hypothetical protein